MRQTIDALHPQRELYARWIRKEGFQPNRVQSITFNGPSPRSSRTVTLVLLKTTKDRDEKGRRKKTGAHPYALGDRLEVEVRTHKILHRPPLSTMEPE